LSCHVRLLHFGFAILGSIGAPSEGVFKGRKGFCKRCKEDDRMILPATGSCKL
jgi:hypothetical protein